MKKLTVYGYMKCDTCRRALKWLEAHECDTEFIDITQDPPNAATLGALLDTGDYQLKQLLNTSGRAYREPGVKDKLAAMGRDETLTYLAGEGMLIKRPIVTDGTRFTVGFRETAFDAAWG
ncbi:MAG: Spx/MgsR family RNA polymerase-binding regulatory protein [Planctomycetota bacterium]